MTSRESKFIVLVRHGELDNPKNIVYNRDSVMVPEDIIHISKTGRDQMKKLGESLKRKFKVKRISTSPQTRTTESSEELSKALGGIDVIVDDDINEVFAPGPYLGGMTMDEFSKNKINVYDENVWGKYSHEKPSVVITRMQRALMRITEELINGETAVVMSHGDPLAWCLNTLNGQEMPQSENLRKMVYPAKGEAVVLTIEKDKISIIYAFSEGKQRENIY